MSRGGIFVGAGGQWISRVLGVLGRLCSLFSHFFSPFSCIFLPSRVLNQFFSILDRFLEVFGRFWEGFGEVFSMFFCSYIEKRDFVKISVSPRREHENQGFELSQNSQKSMTNR